jgi:hypothetical protein
VARDKEVIPTAQHVFLLSTCFLSVQDILEFFRVFNYNHLYITTYVRSFTDLCRQQRTEQFEPVFETLDCNLNTDQNAALVGSRAEIYLCIYICTHVSIEKEETKNVV